MHTTRARGGTVIIHNSDWSGIAAIRWTQNGKEYERDMPAEILRDVALAIAKREVELAVEKALDEMGE